MTNFFARIGNLFHKSDFIDEWETDETEDTPFDTAESLFISPTDNIHVTLDIGGSLTKICLFVPMAMKSNLSDELYNLLFVDVTPSSTPSTPSHIMTPKLSHFSEYIQRDLTLLFEIADRNVEGTLFFFRMMTSQIDEAVAFVKALRTAAPISSLCGTGGGMVKFHDLFKKELPGISLINYDEMKSIVTGANFLIANVEDETFWYLQYIDSEHPEISQPTRNPPYPYLFVNIGTGTSIIRVDETGSYSRVTGSLLGGGAFFGLSSLLTNQRDFDEMIDLAKGGNSTNVNMTIGDIYGEDYGGIGLKKTAAAGAFAKVQPTKDKEQGSEEVRDSFSHSDMIRTVLDVIVTNTAQLVFFVCSQHSIKNVYFGGSFLHNNNIAMAGLSNVVGSFSSSQLKTCYLRHDSFIGAIGAMMLSLGCVPTKTSIECPSMRAMSPHAVPTPSHSQAPHSHHASPSLSSRLPASVSPSTSLSRHDQKKPLTPIVPVPKVPHPGITDSYDFSTTSPAPSPSHSLSHKNGVVLTSHIVATPKPQPRIPQTDQTWKAYFGGDV
ncbi:putative Pantothenate kinase 2 [Blattamonas nauphoetae]|uniref:Pantothenate kinase 2 n=1 Tax=Blattamonas nauphoetae TaxID=2049346 RepID=A0ABQ9WRQ5_9EUKA|nr:putative Pantothenate kinase 2 [Blattamonas nauphoetae]